MVKLLPSIVSKYWSNQAPVLSSRSQREMECSTRLLKAKAPKLQVLGTLQALIVRHKLKGQKGCKEAGEFYLVLCSHLPHSSGATAAYQLVVADRQVSYFSPVHQDHIKTALWLPAIHTQRILEAAVQAAAIWVEEHTPGRKAGGELGTASQPHTVPQTPQGCISDFTEHLQPHFLPIRCSSVQHLQQPKLLPSKDSFRKSSLHPHFSLCLAHCSRN